MPWKPQTHRPPGFTPARRVRRDDIDRAYGTQVKPGHDIGARWVTLFETWYQQGDAGGFCLNC